MTVFRHLSVKWKIYFIAIISIMGFGFYLAFNVWVNNKNSVILESLHTQSFPVLEKAKEARVGLDRTVEYLNNVVLLGETDDLNKADDGYAAIQQLFNDISKIDAAKTTAVASLQKMLTLYYEPSKAIAIEMSSEEADMEKLASKIEAKETALNLLHTNLDQFISETSSAFSKKVAVANANAQTLLTSGFFIWIINIALLLSTVYVIAKIILTNINSVSKSLDDIAHGGGDFSKKITVDSTDEIGQLAKSFNGLMDNLSEKTNDLISMMSNMHQGLLTITHTEQIHQEYSLYIEKIFNTQKVAGQNYLTLLFEHAVLGSNALDQVKVSVSSLLGSDEMMFEFNKHLLITEYAIHVTGPNQEPLIKMLELDWDPIVADGIIDKIMVTVRDVTQLKAMQAEAEGQKRELRIIGQILKASPEKFDAFFTNAMQLLSKNQDLINQNSQKNLDVVAQLFVNMHTIKGNARTYNFDLITDPVHEAENCYDRLRKEDDYLWVPEQLMADIEIVKKAIQRYQTIKTEKLTFNTTPTSSSTHTWVANTLVAKMHEDCEALLQSPTMNKPLIESLLKAVKSLDSVPLPTCLNELVASLPSIAQQLNKATPIVHFNTDDLAVRNQYTHLINDVCTHLLRNSIDHGIETPEERAQAGKPPQGTIDISCTPSADGHMILYISDDGRGLNIKRLKDKAVASNYLTGDDQNNVHKIADCLFYSGVSTAEKITAISGRGVGMDAVRQYLKQNASNIEIDFPADVSPNADYVHFKLKLVLAPHLCA